MLGRFRHLLESVGPELRQYIVASNDEERPFSRDQRRWVYASSKRQVNTFGFGTDNDLEQAENAVVFKHSPFPEPAPRKDEPGAAPDYRLAPAKVLGAAHARRNAMVGFDQMPDAAAHATWYMTMASDPLADEPTLTLPKRAGKGR